MRWDLYLLKYVPFIGTKKCMAAVTSNPIILNTFAAWQESHTLLDVNISFLGRTPLWGKPYLSLHIADTRLLRWKDKKNQTVADLNIHI